MAARQRPQAEPEDPYRANNLRQSTWAAIKTAQRAIGRTFPSDPNRDIVIKTALDVASMHMDQWALAVDATKETAE